MEQFWADIAKTMAHTKYKFKLAKGDKAIYLVDISKVIEILKDKYEIKLK